MNHQIDYTDYSDCLNATKRINECVRKETIQKQEMLDLIPKVQVPTVDNLIDLDTRPYLDIKTLQPLSISEVSKQIASLQPVPIYNKIEVTESKPVSQNLIDLMEPTLTVKPILNKPLTKSPLVSPQSLPSSSSYSDLPENISFIQTPDGAMALLMNKSGKAIGKLGDGGAFLPLSQSDMQFLRNLKKNKRSRTPSPESTPKASRRKMGSGVIETLKQKVFPTAFAKEAVRRPSGTFKRLMKEAAKEATLDWESSPKILIPEVISRYNTTKSSKSPKSIKFKLPKLDLPGPLSEIRVPTVKLGSGKVPVTFGSKKKKESSAAKPRTSKLLKFVL